MQEPLLALAPSDLRAVASALRTGRLCPPYLPASLQRMLSGAVAGEATRPDALLGVIERQWRDSLCAAIGAEIRIRRAEQAEGTFVAQAANVSLHGLRAFGVHFQSDFAGGATL